MNKIDNIKVSLVVAIYKSAPFLPKLIDSILDQTHRNIEIILVDDGSPDESGKMCDDFAKIDNRIIVIHQMNGGACEARNAGMRIMTGEYFSVVDGDDWLATDYVEYLLNLAISCNADVALTDSCFTSRDLKQVEGNNIEMWSPEQMVALVIPPKMPIGPWSKLYRTDFIKRHNLSFDVPMSGETPYFLTRIAGYAPIVVKGHHRIYYYRLNNHTSALTSNAVIYGLNSLENLKLVKRISTIKTSTFRHNLEWWMWHNYQWVLKLIVATNSRAKYWKIYLYCRFMILIYLPQILCYNDYSCQQIFSCIKHAILPERYAKKIIAQERKALLEDKME